MPSCGVLLFFIKKWQPQHPTNQCPGFPGVLFLPLDQVHVWVDAAILWAAQLRCCWWGALLMLALAVRELQHR